MRKNTAAKPTPATTLRIDDIVNDPKYHSAVTLSKGLAGFPRIIIDLPTIDQMIREKTESSFNDATLNADLRQKRQGIMSTVETYNHGLDDAEERLTNSQEEVKREAIVIAENLPDKQSSLRKAEEAATKAKINMNEGLSGAGVAPCNDPKNLEDHLLENLGNFSPNTLGEQKKKSLRPILILGLLVMGPFFGILMGFGLDLLRFQDIRHGLTATAWIFALAGIPFLGLMGLAVAKGVHDYDKSRRTGHRWPPISTIGAFGLWIVDVTLETSGVHSFSASRAAIMNDMGHPEYHATSWLICLLLGMFVGSLFLLLEIIAAKQNDETGSAKERASEKVLDAMRRYPSLRTSRTEGYQAIHQEAEAARIKAEITTDKERLKAMTKNELPSEEVEKLQPLLDAFTSAYSRFSSAVL